MSASPLCPSTSAIEAIGWGELLHFFDQDCPSDPGWPDGDWPLTGGFQPPELEVAVGAVLVQNTRWENAEKALQSLQAIGLNTAQAIHTADPRLLTQAIRSAGFPERKSLTLRNLALLLQDSASQPGREELLEVKGIGPETADAILAYAFRLPAFVADAYSRRLLGRLGLIPAAAGYAELKREVEIHFGLEGDRLRKFHAKIVQFCRLYCRTRPGCSSCPLRSRCAHAARSQSGPP